MTRRFGRLGAFVGGLAISTIALAVLASSIDLTATGAALARVRLERLAPIAVVLAVQFSLRTFRWSRLAASLRPESPVPMRRFAAPLAIGYLGNAVLPARLGEPLRAAVLGRSQGLPVASVLGTVLVERVVDTLTLAALAGIVASLIAPEWMARLAAVVAAVAVVALAVLIVGGRFAAARLGRATHGPWHWAATVGGGAAVNVATAVVGIPRSALGIAVVISVAAWGCDALLFWLVSFALGIDLSPASAFLVAAVTVLGTAIPSAPGYVGTFEAAAVGAAVAFGVPSSDALALAALAHVCSTVPVASIGAVALARLGLGRRALNDPALLSDPAAAAAPNR